MDDSNVEIVVCRYLDTVRYLDKVSISNSTGTTHSSLTARAVLLSSKCEWFVWKQAAFVDLAGQKCRISYRYVDILSNLGHGKCWTMGTNFVLISRHLFNTHHLGLCHAEVSDSTLSKACILRRRWLIDLFLSLIIMLRDRSIFTGKRAHWIQNVSEENEPVRR